MSFRELLEKGQIAEFPALQLALGAIKGRVDRLTVASIGVVHLEPDLQQEEDHAELTKDAYDVVALDQVQRGRPDEDPGHDLADDRRHPDPFRDLGRHLGREQEDEDVQKDRVHAHGRAPSTLRR